MDHSNSEAGSADAASDKRTLVMAVLVPFGVIGLLAAPLAFNTFRHLAGL